MNEDRKAAFGVRYLRVDSRPSVLRPDASPALCSASLPSPVLHIRLLGGFRVERADTRLTVVDWPRRSAKTLTKLLAAHTRHAMHREQIINILWPDVDVGSALNSLGKALHAARHVLEPGLPRRQDSAYLRTADCMLILNTELVIVDADTFERLAAEAMRSGQAEAYRDALLAYEGELLPEDRYESWCAERRTALVDTHIRLLLGLAEVQERCGACNEAADLLREVLRHDPTREAVHRQLMRLYVRMGTPDQAVRQFHIFEQVLRQELDLAPQPETVALYDEIHEDRFSRSPPSLDRIRERAESRSRPPARNVSTSTFVGREQVIEGMCELLARQDETRVGMVVVGGEAGVGKTRLLEEFAAQASEQGAIVLRGGGGAHGDQFSSGPFAVALEDHAGRLPGPERAELARRYPALARFVPSLRGEVSLHTPAPDPRGYQLDLIATIVQFLTDLAREKPVLLVLGDLNEVDEVGLDLIRYLAHLAARGHLLIAAALRDPDIENGPGLRRMAEAMTRERLWLRMELRCLSRRATDQLVQVLLPGIDVNDDTLTGIYAASRGNPLFVQELADAIGSDGDAVGAGHNYDLDDLARLAARLPARTHALTALQLALMEQPLRRVLGLTAAVGAGEISLDHLRAAAAALEPPLAVSVLFDALDRALRMRILEERGRGYAFRHPVVRAAVYDCLPRHRRHELHAALAVAGDKFTAGPRAGR
jgi:DNA-binding SARP family transcriptional activator